MHKSSTGYTLLSIAADAGSSMDGFMWTTIGAGLSLLDKNIATSARFYTYITEKSHAKKFMYFPDRGCVLTLCHLYGYTTAHHDFILSYVLWSKMGRWNNTAVSKLKARLVKYRDSRALWLHILCMYTVTTYSNSNQAAQPSHHTRMHIREHLRAGLSADNDATSSPKPGSTCPPTQNSKKQ